MKNKDYRNGYGIVSNVNKRVMNKSGKFKLNKIGLVAIITAANITIGGIIGGIFGYNIGKKNKQPDFNLIPENCVMINIDIDVEKNDELDKILSRFYSEDEYSGVYKTFEDYRASIMELNDISNPNYINSDNNLTLPVIIDSKNEYYLQVQALNYQINKIEKENYWVDYIIQPGDKLTTLAYRASSSDNEAMNIKRQIIRENNIVDEDNISYGKPIKIVNPELGPLKIARDECMEYLIDSITITNHVK